MSFVLSLFGKNKSFKVLGERVSEKETSKNQSKDMNNDFSEAKKRLLALREKTNKAYVKSLNKRFKKIRCDIRNWDHIGNTYEFEIRKHRDISAWYCNSTLMYCDEKIAEREVSKFVKLLNEEGFKASYNPSYNGRTDSYSIHITIETES